MEPLVKDMIQDNPSSRPTMDQVVERFSDIQKSLSWWTLRSRLVPREEHLVDNVLRSLGHFFRTTGYMLTLRGALPSP